MNAQSNKGFDKSDYQRFSPMVRRIAMRLGNRLPSCIDINDLIAAGWVGALEVLGRVDRSLPEGEVNALVTCRVRGAMLDHLRALDPASRRVRRASRKVNRAKGVLATQLGRQPTEREVAGELGISVEAYRAIELEVQHTNTVSADHELAAVIASDVPNPETVTDHSRRVDRVAKAIAALPERMRLVMTMIYQDDRQQFEVAEVLGVSPARVCQMHREAMTILRRELRVA